MIKAAVFDLDHTLFDRYETLKLAVPLLREKLDVSKDVTDEYFAEQISWADKQYVHHGWHEIHEHLIKCGIFNTEPSLDDYTESLLSCFKKVAVKYDFTNPMLKKLREMGIKTGIITNGRHEIQSEKIKMLELNGLFDDIMISGDYDFRKPDERIFKTSAEHLGVDVSEMFYVGDHPLADVNGSRNAGCVPVWVKTTGTWIFPEIEKPELQVETVAEIPDLIERLNNGK